MVLCYSGLDIDPENHQVLVCPIPIAEQNKPDQFCEISNGIHRTISTDKLWLKEKLCEDLEISLPCDFWHKFKISKYEGCRFESPIKK